MTYFGWTNMSNSTTASLSEETSGGVIASLSPRPGTNDDDLYRFNPLLFKQISSSNQHDLHHQHKAKKKRNLPGNPDPEAEVVALSPKTLMATNRFVCEICNKGFQRDQNLQLHRRGHNLPWKLRQKNSKESVRKRVYICPEPTCVHNHPSRALGDLTGIKKHFCRKHGEKVWKCDKCSKKYAVMSDWKAHAKTCGTREYKCDCGTLFSRKDSFITHRAFCDALAEESARLAAAAAGVGSNPPPLLHTPSPPPQELLTFPWDQFSKPNPNTDSSSNNNNNNNITSLFPSRHQFAAATAQLQPQVLVAPQPHLSATELLQKASTMGCMATSVNAIYAGLDMGGSLSTRNFLGGRVVEANQIFLPGLDLDLVNNPTATTTDASNNNNNNNHGITGFLSQQQWRGC